MIYMFIGPPSSEKDQLILKLRNSLLTTSDMLRFDFENLDGHKLDPAILKEALYAFSAMSKRRVLVIRNVHKFTDHHERLMEEFLAGNNEHAELILDWSGEARGGFLLKLKAKAKVKTMGKALPTKVFDLTDLMPRQPAQALNILRTLYEEGNHPLQILAILVWFWGSVRSRMAISQYRQGLCYLRDADLNIKRSRFEPRSVIEVLVVKLCELMLNRAI